MKYTAKPLPPTNLPELRQVGKPLRRVDAIGKTTGKTLYAADLFMPNMLYSKVFRSSVPHARIKRLDVSKARSLPGVVCVLTHEDLPQSVLVTDMPGQTGQKRRAGSDAHVLASDVVRFVGDPIALVAAESLAIAEHALELIEVEYEILPAVYDPLEAMKPGAPIVSSPDNIVGQWKMRKGDLQAGFEAADLIVENTFSVPFIDHAYLELEAGLAWIDDRGIVNIRVCTQVVEHFRSIALALGIPQNKLHIQGTMVGGGFGGKEDITVEIFIGLLTLATKRPVLMEYTREESLMAHSKRHPFVITHKTGVTKDGKITAAQIKMIANSGAYVYLSPYVLLYATGAATGPYRVDNLHVDSYAVATNNPFTSAFRGFGVPQACFAYERQMDEIAQKLGMDPYEFRCKNYLKTGERGVNQEIKTAAWLEETASRALEALGEKTPNHGVVKVGQGFASYMQSYGRIMWFHDTSQAWVSLELDGTVTIRSGIPDLGAGHISAACQIASEILGVSLDQVTIYNTDSALTPLAGTSTATRQLFMSGNAVFQAASAVRKTLLDRASKQLEEPAENLDIADGRVFVKTAPEQFIELPELAAKCAAEGLPLSNLALFKAPFTDPIDQETGQGDIWPDFTFGCQAIEAAVDTETGEVTILKSVACHDVGRAVNPAAVRGQIEGGGLQGIGYALMEEVIVKDGKLVTPSLSEYLIPTSVDVPKTKVIILESGTGLGPFGAKGIGEPSLTPAAAAVANAVANAIGAPINSLPLTPEKVLQAIDLARRNG
jgi:CO/xanthine dehydrogenase Mo-binding subunit